MSPKSRTLPDPASEPTITVERTAAILGTGLRSTYSAVERGEIPAVRVGRSVRVLTAKFLRAYGLDGEAA